MAWLASHLFSIVGFLLAIVLVSSVFKERRSPSSTLAWILAILLAPWLGVPLYLIFGGRKIRRLASKKDRLYARSPIEAPASNLTGVTMERILCSYGGPGVAAGNRIELCATGEAAYAKLVELIDGAKRSIHVTTFILGVDEVGDAILERLAKKAREGVEVRLLLDALGCFHGNRRLQQALVEAGGRIAFFMPMLHVPFRGHANLRNHRKLVVVDGRTAMVGGMNLALEYLGPTPHEGRWRDVAVRIEGPVVADVAALFRSDWAFASGEALRAADVEPLSFAAGASIQVAPSGPDCPEDMLYDALLTALFEARERVWIATPYFVPDEALARAIELAVRRGVDVRIVLPWPSNHFAADLAGGSYLRQLGAAGARVLRFRRGMMHAKVTVIDERCAILGSANMDMRSLFLNYEIALFFYSRNEIALLAAWFEALERDCDEGLPAAGRARLLAEDVGRLLAPLV